MASERLSGNITATANATDWAIATVAFVLLAGLWLATTGGRTLFNPDEGRYAEVPREMIASGDWLTPRLNDLKYFEKPPLQYWATAVAYKVFGVNEFASRLWCALTGIGLIALIGWLGSQLLHRDVGLLAAVLLSGSWMHIMLGHINTLDMGFVFFLYGALGFFLVAQGSPIRSKTERNWMLAAWAMTAAALLSKGVAAIVLPGLTLIAYCSISKDWSIWKRLHLRSGLSLFLLIAAPWFIAVSIANPEFPRFFFVHEHLHRYFTQVHDRVEPWWYFLPLLFIGSLPWATLTIPALFSALRPRGGVSRPRSSLDGSLFLALWILVVVVFFSLSQSKLATYILPALPALALLSARHAATTSPRNMLWHVLPIVLLSLVLLGYLFLVNPPARPDISPEAAASVFDSAKAAVVFALAGALFAAWFAHRGRVAVALIALSTGSFLCISTLIIAIGGVRGFRSGYDLAAAVAPHVHRDTKIYSLYQYDHSLTFYLQRPVTLVGYRGELDFGLTQEPGKWLQDEGAFVRAWTIDAPGSIALLPHDSYRRLAAAGVPMTALGETYRVKIVEKPLANRQSSAAE